MDLFAGDGSALRQIARDDLIQGGVSVSLKDKRSDESISYDNSKNLKFIPGNILTRKPWQEIEKWLKEQNKTGFDLIIIRPLGGYLYIPEEIGVCISLLKRVQVCLAPKGGMLLAELPDLPEQVFKNAIKNRDLCEGFDYKLKHNQGVLKVVRT